MVTHWQLIEESSNSVTERLRVPGGWLYRVARARFLGEEKLPTVLDQAVAFVPAVPAVPETDDIEDSRELIRAIQAVCRDDPHFACLSVGELLARAKIRMTDGSHASEPTRDQKPHRHVVNLRHLDASRRWFEADPKRHDARREDVYACGFAAGEAVSPDRQRRVALVRKVLGTVIASLDLGDTGQLTAAVMRACIERVDPEGLLDELEADGAPSPSPMVPGGVDFVVHHRATPDDVTSLLCTLRAHWPEMVVEDESNVWAPAGTNPTGAVPRELFVYRDHDSHESWGLRGAAPDNAPYMVHLLFGPESTTAVAHPDSDAAKLLRQALLDLAKGEQS